LNTILYIGFGGFIGAVLRYIISGSVQQWVKPGFPYGTLVVNILGCLMIGILSYLTETRSTFSPEIRSFVFIGLLGAFTTFSTFSNETVGLFKGSAGSLALANVSIHLVLGLAAVWFGNMAARLMWR
jgi:fluoride exporter